MVLGCTKSSMSSGRGGGIVEGEVWQSGGWVAGCCSLDGCDLGVCLFMFVLIVGPVHVWGVRRSC